MKATALKNTVVLNSIHMIGGESVFQTVCRDFEMFCQLPEVIEYNGIVAGKTGWNSDTGFACYRSRLNFARAR